MSLKRTMVAPKPPSKISTWPTLAPGRDSRARAMRSSRARRALHDGTSRSPRSASGCSCGRTGIAGMEDMKKVGRVGLKSLLYFEAVSTLALVIGLAVVNTTQPGAGMNVDVATLDTKALASYTSAAKSQSTVDFLLNVIPNTIVDAFARGEILHVLLFSLLFRLD